MLTRRAFAAGLLLAVGAAVFLASWGWTAGEVEPGDINPLADLLGGILAVPLARMFAALCFILAFLALARGLGGTCLFLVILGGLVLIGPALMRTVVERAAQAVQG